MSKIFIQNFGPIKEGLDTNDGWIEIKKFTIFIGNQGSGKSTVAKVISIMAWLEKAINRGDVPKVLSTSAFKQFFKYQRIHNYFTINSQIAFIGEYCTIHYYNGELDIKYHKNINFFPPKIMYIPAERNFLSVVKSAFDVKDLPDSLFGFAEELRKIQLDLHNKNIELPINGLKYKFVKNNNTSLLISDDFVIDLAESSSGQQSLVPLYLVTKYLTKAIVDASEDGSENVSVSQQIRRDNEIKDIKRKKNIDENTKEKYIKDIYQKYKSHSLINIVEEPEQNLFPTSQFQAFKFLIESNNEIKNNKLILTTHSPYIFSYITISLKAGILYRKMNKNKISSLYFKKLNKLFPLDCSINEKEINIYQLDDNKGQIKLLKNYQGIPKDNNYLNNQLAASNELFDKLLDFEEEWL